MQFAMNSKLCNILITFCATLLLSSVVCDEIKEVVPAEELSNPVPAPAPTSENVQLNAPAPASAPNPPAPEPVPQREPQQPHAQPMAQGEGTTTEHRSPDGSIITITKFNGNLPSTMFQPYGQGGYSPFYQPFYNYNPFGWPFGPMQMTGAQQQGPSAPSITAVDSPAVTSPQAVRARRAAVIAKPVAVTSDITSNDINPVFTLPKRARHSAVFHYPATAEDYWKIHKKPEVPVTPEQEKKSTLTY